MFKKLCLAAGLVTSVLFAGCANVAVKPISIPVIPPAQLATQFCPLVKADLAILAGSPIVLQAQKDALTKVTPINDAVCSAAATVDLTDLQSFNNTLFPAVTAVVAAVPAIPNQPAILLALQLAQPLLNQIVTDAIAATKATATAPATPASGASAPVAASSAMVTFESGETLTAADLNRNFDALNRRLETLEADVHPLKLSEAITENSVVSTPLAGAPLQ